VRTLSAIYNACLQILAPAEGEEWLVGLAVALLLLGAARHRLEPWLAGVAADPPVGAAEVPAASAAAPAAADSSAGAREASAHPPVPALPPAVAGAVARIEPASFGRVDLNRATAEELETLPRIGPALAARIVADRAARGPFATIEDLDRVKGIGPATLAALAGDVVVDPPPGDSPASSSVGDSTRPGAAAFIARPAPRSGSPAARASAE
jgi:competence ComEA-like helix-hairpin-helix protein